MSKDLNQSSDKSAYEAVRASSALAWLKKANANASRSAKQTAKNGLDPRRMNFYSRAGAGI